MIAVVPSDWHFLIMGSNESLQQIRTSLPIEREEGSGKLELRNVAEYQVFYQKGKINHMFADLSFYNEYLSGVDWLLVYQSDSIMGAAASSNLNEWLDHDWVGDRQYVFRQRPAKIV